MKALSVASIGLLSFVLSSALATAAPEPSASDGPPVCDAGGPYYGECQDGKVVIQLDGTGSYNPGGGALSYMWRVDCGNAVLLRQFSATPTLVIDLEGACAGQCARVHLLVRNSCGLASCCSTTVSFEDSLAPTISCPPDLQLSPGEPTDPAYTGFAQAYDQCNPLPLVTWSDLVSMGPKGETIITRTWTADDGCLTASCQQRLTIPPPCGPPDLDIKPGSCPNPVNVTSNGVIPVALTGSTAFDVTQVDLSTLRLARSDGVGGSVAPLPGQVSVADTATPFDGDLCDCHALVGDGIDDLNLKFDTPATVTALQLGSLPNMTTLQLDLSGTLLDGTPFLVSDCIRAQDT